MKKILLGFIAGSLVTVGATQLMSSRLKPQQDMTVSTLQTESAASENTSTQINPIRPANTVQVVETSASFDSEDSQQLAKLSKEALIEQVQTYQKQVDTLTTAVKNQQQALNSLNEKLQNNGQKPRAADLSKEEAALALENIRQALIDSDPEYQEVLKSALHQYENNLELIAPGQDAMLRHYSEEPEYAWSEAAKAFLQNYFANSADNQMQLIQLNCRSSYCELYGFYTMTEVLSDYRVPTAKISKFLRDMQDAPNYKTYFRSAENISLNNSSDNNFMTFHVFIRSANN